MKLVNVSRSKFLEMTKGKRIVCFGSGKYLDEFCGCCNITDRIKLIVDNAPEKSGTYREVLGQHIPICSLDNAIARIDGNDILLITTGRDAGVDIYRQIERIPFFENRTIYWAWIILISFATVYESTKPTDIVFRLTEKPLIPKIIHYCWFGGNPIPEKFQEYINGWKKFCPDYEIIEWNEKNYDINKNKYMRQAYDAKKWGFVPDYIRKDVIYEYGGIYLDTDVEVIKNLDDFLYQDGFCCFESDYINFGSGFGAKKHLPIIKILRDMYDDLEFYFDDVKTVVTGPMNETAKLEEYGLNNNGQYQKIAGLTVYPRDVLSGTNQYTGEPYITKNTYTLHHYAASWYDEDTKGKMNAAREIIRMAFDEGK